MMHELPARDVSGLTHVIVDTPKGSRNKIKWDEGVGCFRLSRILPAGAVFPFNFGFIPGTRAEDGDALDVLVLMDEDLPTGTLVTVRLLGVLQARQKRGRKSERNDRLIAVPKTPVNDPLERDIGDIESGRLAQIEHFFVSYNLAQGRTFVVTGRKGAKAAARVLRAAMAAFAREHGGRG